MRYLVLCHEGAPMAVDTFPDPLRKIILDHPDDDAELWSIWETPPAGSLAPSIDITEQFALTWAMEFSFGDGIERSEVLAPFPAFVREIAGDKLLAKWQAEIVAALPITPNPLKRRAA